MEFLIFHKHDLRPRLNSSNILIDAPVPDMRQCPIFCSMIFTMKASC